MYSDVKVVILNYLDHVSNKNSASVTPLALQIKISDSLDFRRITGWLFNFPFSIPLPSKFSIEQLQ